MPRIKPLEKLVSKARRLRNHHQERHRPSGFGFALADRVDYLDPVRWDALTAQSSMFLSRRYLRVLEEAGPENSNNVMRWSFAATNRSRRSLRSR